MITDILGLLTKVPKLISGIKGGNKSLAEKAINIAKTVTGLDDEQSATDALANNPELLYQYELALLADKHIPDRLANENTQGARVMYGKHNEKADEIAGKIINYNIWFVVALVVANILVVKYVEEAAMVAIASNFIGMAMKQFMTERQNVVNFFFGSSMGSKTKDKG